MKPKMFVIGGDRCPIRLFDLYVSKRPFELRDRGRFYLTPKPQTSLTVDSVCYTRNPVGKNKNLGKISVWSIV